MLNDLLNRTSVKYSSPSRCTGIRMMLVCEVALGKCYDCFEHNMQLKSPPDGFDSNHGVAGSPFRASQFMVGFCFSLQFCTILSSIDRHVVGKLLQQIR